MDKVVHFEVPIDEPERAKEFYEKVFEWKFNEIPEMNYTIAITSEVDEENMPIEKGAINGGLYKRGEGASKTPVIVIDVENIDGKIEQIEANGGKVIRPKAQVGDMGHYAQVEDTEGNIIGIWERIIKK